MSKNDSKVAAGILIGFSAVCLLLGLIALELAILGLIVTGLIWASNVLFGTAIAITFKTVAAATVGLYLVRFLLKK